MIKCNVCGHEFEAVTDKHYISRDCGTTGIKAITGEVEPFLYDTYDCPKCGSQYIAQIRKRIYEPMGIEPEEEQCADTVKHLFT